MTSLRLMTLAGLGSAAMLLGAFAFQYIGGLAPCQLCLWQRWPHAAAVVILVLAFLTGRRELAWAGMLAALATAGIGVFHVGVEQQWWAGLESCTVSTLGNTSVEDLLNPSLDVALPARCDQIAWSMFGISMAGWNVIVSLGLAAIWALGGTRRD